MYTGLFHVTIIHTTCIYQQDYTKQKRLSGNVINDLKSSHSHWLE